MVAKVFVTISLTLYIIGTVQTLSLKDELGKYKFGQDGNCTFDKGFCNWRNAHSGDTFDWLRHSKGTPSAGTGPSKDASGKGYYVYIETSHPRKKGEEASLHMGPLIGVLCMRFSYHMYGADTGDLQIYMKERDHSKQLFIWARYGEQGQKWIKSNVTVYGLAYDIIVVARAGGGYRGDIAFDEVTFVPGTCYDHEDETELLLRRVSGENNSTSVEIKGSCDFDSNDLCGWSQDILGDNFDFIAGSDGTPTSGTGPKKDHGGNGGNFMYIEASSPRRFKDKARLISPQLCGQVCIRFYYHMYGSTMGVLSVQRNDGLNNKKYDRLWYKRGNQGNVWHRGIVEVNSDQDCYQVMFEASVGHSYYSDMAIDDIYVQKGSCCNMKSELNNLDKTGNCNFEKGFCGWKNLNKIDDFDWTLGKGPTPSELTGPKDGFLKDGYAFIEASEPRIIYDTAIMTSGVLLGSMCMRFRYHMYGEEIGSLAIYRNGDGVMQQLLWRQDGNQGNTWHEAEFLIDCNVTAYKVEIEATVGGWRGDIAVDEIEFTPGLCPPKPVIIIDYNNTAEITQPPPIVHEFDGFCNFGNSFCSWKNDGEEDFFDWKRHSGTTPSENTGPNQDYSGEGYFIYIESSSHKEGQFARLVSGSLQDTHCLTFQYHMFGDEIGELRVETKDSENGYLWNTTWSISGNQGASWKPALVTVQGYDYVIGVSAVRGKSFTSDIAIDSINIAKGACDNNSSSFAVDAASKFDLVDCTFDAKTKCQWKDDAASNFKWTLRKGRTPSTGTGPSKHAGSSDKGFYAYIEASSPRVENEVARMYIDVPLKVCMSFFYHMRGKSVGALKVIAKNKASDKVQVLWSKKGNQGNHWIEEDGILINGEDGVQVVIEGVVGSSYSSDIAIDEIRFRQGDCPN